MFRYFLFNLKCRFSHRYEWQYYKELDIIREVILGDYVYPWEQFVHDVKQLAEIHNIPERYVYQDLRDIMPLSKNIS